MNSRFRAWVAAPWLGLLVIFALSSLTTDHANSAPTLRNWVFGRLNGEHTYGQTFVAAPGELVAIRVLLLANPSSQNDPVTLRLRYAAGDMFKDVPPADAYVLKLIMHDWDDASCATILSNVCARLEPGGRVICIDNVMPPLGDVSDVPQKLLDVNMMLLLPGKERTRVEWEALYRGAGLAITAMAPVPDAFNMFVIEGRLVGGS